MKRLSSTTNESLNDRLESLVVDLVEGGISLAQARAQFEKQFIVASLRSNEGSFGRSADSLGIHRNTLRNKLCALGITPADFSSRTRRRA